MKILMNGNEHEIQSDAQGNVQVVDVRKAANVTDGRSIIMQKTSGENIVLPTNGAIAISPYTHFIDSPRARRGSR